MSAERIFAIIVTPTAHLPRWGGRNGLGPRCWTPGVPEAIDRAKAEGRDRFGPVGDRAICLRCIASLRREIETEQADLAAAEAHNAERAER